MVRIRIGEGWASDAEVREGLRAEGVDPRRRAVRAIVDLLAVEVDGVDIGAGRTEGPVAAGLLSLLQAVTRLSAGEEHASLPFDDGAVELLLHRRDGVALLSVATLSRPARLLAHDVAVDLPRLTQAAREAALQFCERVEGLAPGIRALPDIRRLVQAARRTVRPPRGSASSFELQEDGGGAAPSAASGPALASLLVRGRVVIRSPAGRELLSIDGAPFLVFRDLVAAASRIAADPAAHVRFDLARPGRSPPLRVDVTGGTVSTGDADPVPCDPLSFASAIVEGAAALVAALVSRAPAQAGNALLAELSRSAESARLHIEEAREGDRPSPVPRRLRTPRERGPSAIPLSPGRLRVVTFHRFGSIEVGSPSGDGLLRTPDVYVACGGERTVGLARADARPLWKAPGSSEAACDGARLFLLRGEELEARSVLDGRALWARPRPPRIGSRTTLAVATGGRLALACGGVVSLLDGRSGAALWSFTSPGATRLRLLRAGPLLLAASDTGMVHALDGTGAIVWRLRGPGPPCAAAVTMGRSLLVSFRTPAGSTFTRIDLSTGRRVQESSLDFTVTGTPTRFAGRIALAGTVAGDGVVAAVDLDGSPAWAETSSGRGAPVLAHRDGRLFVKSADGSCSALDREGLVLWARSIDGRQPPPGNLAPVAARGVLLMPAQEVEVLDPASGALLGTIPSHAPSRILVDDRLDAWTLDPDGLVNAFRLRRHLSVVAPACERPIRPPGRGAVRS